MPPGTFPKLDAQLDDPFVTERNTAAACLGMLMPAGWGYRAPLRGRFLFASPASCIIYGARQNESVKLLVGNA